MLNEVVVVNEVDGEELVNEDEVVVNEDDGEELVNEDEVVVNEDKDDVDDDIGVKFPNDDSLDEFELLMLPPAFSVPLLLLVVSVSFVALPSQALQDDSFPVELFVPSELPFVSFPTSDVLTVALSPVLLISLSG
jgi:hypothetical protein